VAYEEDTHLLKVLTRLGAASAQSIVKRCPCRHGCFSNVSKVRVRVDNIRGRGVAKTMLRTTSLCW
jgi:hypothetical protein